MHKPSGRILDVYTDMPCIFLNTAQDFQNYGKMLFKEEILKVAEIATPLAIFGENGNEQENSVYDEYKSTSNLELMLENEREVEHAMETLFTQSDIQESLPIIGKSKVVYTKHSGICIRPQLFPDAVSHVSMVNNYSLQDVHINIIFFRKTSRVLYYNHQICIVNKPYINLELLFQIQPSENNDLNKTTYNIKNIL